MNAARTNRDGAADGTQEVAAIDILEETPLPDSPAADDIPVDVDMELAPSRGGPHSISPLSLSILPVPRRAAESTFKIVAVKTPPRRRLGGVVTGAMALAVCILLAAGVRASLMGPIEPLAPLAGATLPPVQPVLAAAAAQPWRTMSEATAMSGTVTSHAGALFIDGARISAKSALVSCGHHQLKAGRGKAHDVDVPCGGTLLVDRSGKATVLTR